MRIADSHDNTSSPSHYVGDIALRFDAVSLDRHEFTPSALTSVFCFGGSRVTGSVLPSVSEARRALSAVTKIHVERNTSGSRKIELTYVKLGAAYYGMCNARRILLQ